MKTWIALNSICALAVCAAGALALAPKHGNEPGTKAAQPSTADIVDTAVSAGSFKTLAAALQAAGLVETLKGTDEAFAKLPAGTVENLLKPENRAQLVSILTYHVVAGSVDSKQAMTLKHASTVNGQRLDISTDGKTVKIDGKASVVKADIACSNGVIHVIDSVVLPEQKNILEVAGNAGSFTTLTAAIKAAGLTDVLSGKGPFTVFAPTDEAFQKLPAGTLESLLKPENKEKLASILKFHVIPGAVYADQIVKMKESPKTVQGQTIQIEVKDGRVTIGNATANAGVAATDVEASNGVIHVIDTVLMPK
jgi:uncharacterized surface protein with fasciclin (FAS1) repeats